MGLEREEHKDITKTKFAFGGIRTFPLIGFLGYLFAKISDASLIPFSIGFATLGAFLLLSYRNKLSSGTAGGLTSEMSACLTYVVGALVFRQEYWVATTLVILCVFLLELKGVLEGLAQKIPASEIFAFTKFILLAAVILPVLPNQNYTSFELNPFKTWLIVVVISGVSYGAYLLGKLFGKRGGILISALLGGIYSSTVTTLFLARRTRSESFPKLFSGAILMSTGMMYFRLIGLLFILNAEVAKMLLVPFLCLGLIALIGGWAWSKAEKNDVAQTAAKDADPTNPLEMLPAFGFAFLFTLMSVLTRLVEVHIGSAGVYGLSFVSGLSDVDPFIASISQSGAQTTLAVMATAILIATLSNNLLKGVYVFYTAKGEVRKTAPLMLFGISLVGTLSLLFLR